MQHFHSIDNLTLEKTWVTIGSFDGVHLGHQALIRALVDGAHAAGNKAVVVTFFPHPAVVIRHIQHPFYLATPEERAGLMDFLGVDAVVTLEFTTDLAGLSAEDFTSILVRKLGMCLLLAGPDFALGKNRQGSIDVLKELGQKLNFRISTPPPIVAGGIIISSSGIRRSIQEGEVAKAAANLGHWYSISGKVLPGDNRGHKLGFPTANLEVWPEKLLPKCGVYATRTILNGHAWPSVTNIGFRPTFESLPVKPRIEVHILDLNQDVYGKELRVEFVEFIRLEKRFPSVDELRHQIQNDVQQAREVLKDATRTSGIPA